MATTYETIASYTIASTQTDVTFSSIPATYTDLEIHVFAKLTTSSNNLNYRFNGDTSAIYSYQQMNASGSSTAADRSSNQTSGRTDNYGYLDTNWASHVIYVFDYANGTTHTPMLSKGNNASNGLGIVANIWRSTATITSITLMANNIAAGSVFALYGIKAA